MEKIQLLVVDDERRFLATCEKLLSRRGFEVLTADSGAGALALLETHSVQVVVLDVKMPGMDGIETLGTIKQQYPQLEVIILTGYSSIPSVVEAMQIGASDYLMKPVSMDQMIEKIREVANRSLVRNEADSCEI